MQHYFATLFFFGVRSVTNLQHRLNSTVSQSDQGMQCKAKSGEKAEFTWSK